ncbi:Ig-like domain-containing protein, partial [Pseudoalteromonas luteoviolacea]
TAVSFNLLSNDSDPENDMVASSATIVTQPAKGQVSIANGVVTYTPNADVSGQDTFTYTVKDAAQNTSNTATATVNITAVNDAPVAATLSMNTSEDTDSSALQVRSQTTDIEDSMPTGELAIATAPSKGTVVIDQNAGTFVYQPFANQFGADSFTYTVKDSEGLVSAQATVNITIGSVNDKPVADNDSVTTNEDTSITLAVLSNDSDVEDQGFNGANITLENKGNGAGVYDKATVDIQADGQLSITPNADANGSFTFSYWLTDSEGLTSDAATVTVNITPVNDAPVAVDNTATLLEEGSFEVNVLGNDTDVDTNDSLDVSSVTVVAAPQFGQAVVNAQGAIVYTPNTNYFGDDTFTYTVKDAAGAVSNAATVTMTVTAVNDAPVAQAQVLSLDEDGTLQITLSATDQENDALTYRIATDVSHGTLVKQSDTVWLYTPNRDFNGTDSFTFIANDGDLDSAAQTVSLTVNALNDAPTADAQTVAGEEDTDIPITLSGSDVDSNTLTYAIATQPSQGTVILNGNIATYRGNADYVGSDSFTFTTHDGALSSMPVTVSISLSNVNDAPVISGVPASSVNEDSAYHFVPTFNDVDGDIPTFSIVNKPTWASFDSTTGALTGTPVNENVGNYSDIQITVSDGTLSAALAAFSIMVVNTNDAPVISGTPANSVDEDALYSFTPSALDIDGDSLIFAIENKPSWATFDTATGELSGTPLDANVGTAENIQISVSDGQVSVPLSPFSITVANTNDAPQGSDYAVTVNEGEALLVSKENGVLSNASDEDMDSGDFLVAALIKQASHGSVTLNADGSFTYQNNGSEETADSFTYQVVDSFGASSATHIVNIAITPVADAPIALDDSAATLEDQAVSLDLLSNDTDAEHDIVASSATVVTAPSHGEVSLVNGVATYTPHQDFNGTDSFTYIVSDQTVNNSAAATVTISVTAVNDQPQAADISMIMSEDSAAQSIAVRVYATDVEEGNPIGDIAIVTRPTLGQVVVSQDNGTLIYTPNANAQGSDTLTYTIADGNGAVSDPATITFSIGAVNDMPIAQGDQVSTEEDTAVILSVLANDSDIEDNGFNGANITLEDQGNGPGMYDKAQVSVLADGQLEIIPVTNAHGTLTFTYTLTDSEGMTSEPATVTVVITPVNDAPVAASDVAQLEEEGSFAVNVLGNDTDVDGTDELDASSLVIVSTPEKGTVTVDTLGRIVYTGAQDQSGDDTFSYTVRDTSGAVSNVAVVTMAISNTNDAPEAQDDSFADSAYDEETGTYRLDVLSNDTDVDVGDTLALTSAVASVGDVVIEDGMLVYTPETSFNGVVIIEYLVQDAAGEFSTAKVELMVNRNTSSESPPVITVPDDVFVNATGLFTKVDLGHATAVDSNGNPLSVSLIGETTQFSPGRHTANWRATDSNGIESIATQNVFVSPLVSLSKDQRVVEGQVYTLGVYLNGEAASYPVTLPFTVSGTANGDDHSLSNGTVVISEGTSAILSFNIVDDGVVEGNETIVVTLDDSLNLGANSTATLTIIEENIAPVISLSAEQDSQQRTTVAASEQMVTITANVVDANTHDGATLSWHADLALENISTDNTRFAFSPKALSPDVYRVDLTVTDNGVPSQSTTSSIYLDVVEQLNSLDTGKDTDGDLIPDIEEGYIDSDNDGIPDFQDAIANCSVLQQQATESEQFLIEVEPGVCIRKGISVSQNVTGGVQILPEELAADADASNVGGLFDFVATELPQPGNAYSVVIPQRKPVPANAEYRKYKAGVWTDFVIDADNLLLSAKGQQGYCPAPGSKEWTPGLTEGDWCVKLQIVDGGPNDDDGIANGSIVDPGGVAVSNLDNMIPMANRDEVTIGSGQSIIIDVLANDTDADSDTLRILGASVDFGEVVISDNKLNFTPPSTFVGTATIEYSITDNQGGTANSTVAVNLVVNNAPTTQPDTASTDDKTSIVIDVLANDADMDGDVFSVIGAVAQQGRISINEDGTLGYTPKQGFEGVDIVSYQVMDSKGAITDGVAQVTITAYKVVNIDNTSSGSMGGALMLLMSVFVIRRRKAILPSFALVTASCLISQPAMADAWTLKGTVGEARADKHINTMSGLEVTSIDDNSSSWSVAGFYELLPSWHVGIGYVDLGQGRVSFAGESLTPQDAHTAVSRTAPVLPEGFTMQVNYDVFEYKGFTGDVFLGAFNWAYQINSTRENRFLKQYEQSETNAFFGAELGYELTESLSVGLNYTHFDISENHISDIGVSLSVSF